jgi:hypothetical protein
MAVDGSAFAAAVAARIDGFHAELARALAAWRREQGARAAALRARATDLSAQMALALRECQHRVGPAPARSQKQALEALRFVTAWDRERARVEDEVWALLRAARAEELGWRRQVRARADELVALARRIGLEADQALAAATSAATGRSPLGREVEGQVARALARLRRELDRLGARAEVDAVRVATAGVPDFERALAEFDAELATRFVGGTPPPVVRARTIRVARKRARVPKFLLARFYRNGGMRLAGDALEITFTNPLAFCIIQGGDAIVVDGRPHPRERTVLDNGQRSLDGNGFSETSYLKFPKGGELRVRLDGLVVKPGRHRVSCSLELRKMGWVDLNVEDQVS